VALLIVDADCRQIVYDRFALDLELARQIVDADLFQISSQFPVFQFPESTQYPVLSTQLIQNRLRRSRRFRRLFFAFMWLFAVYVYF
jgi:hypothetical protein